LLRSRKIEPVSRMHLETDACSKQRAVTNKLPFGACGLSAPLGQGVAPRARMDLDHGGAKFGRHLDLHRCRTDKQRHLDAGVFEFTHHRSKLVALTGDIEAA